MENEKLKILIIDDDFEIVDGMKGVLTEIGYDVTTIYSGEEALKLIEKENFNIHILDIIMPKMSGLEVLKKAREIKPDANFIMVTGYGNEQKAVDSLNYGAFAYLKKPVLWQELEITINRCLKNEKLVHNKKILEGILMTVRNFEHKINNPLTIILGNAELLQMKFENDPETLELINPIIECSDEISDHIQNLKEIKEIKVWDFIGGKMLDVSKKKE